MIQKKNKKQKILLIFNIFFNFFTFSNATIDFLDTTFGANANGIVTTNIGASAKINSITIDSLFKIIAAGYNVTPNNIQNLIVARYLSNGTLDNVFGTNGIVTTASGLSSPVANAVTTDASGNIVVVGSTIVSSVNNLLVIRYLPTGQLDLNFGTGGKVIKLVGTSVVGNSVVVDSNGKIVIACTSVISSKDNLTVVRLNSNGTVDSTFGTAGVKSITAGNGYTGNSIKIDVNAKIVVGGSAIISTGSNLLLARLNAINGAADTTFGTNGVVTTAIAGNSTSVINSISIDSSNKIVAGGYAGSSTVSNFTVARYNTNGTLDTSFATNLSGIQINPIGSNSQIDSVAIDLNSKIVAGGFSDYTFALARYNINGSLDTTFGNSGVLLTSIGNKSQINSIKVQGSDGRIIAAGFENDLVTNNPQFALVRYNKNNTDFINITSLIDNSIIDTKTPIVSGTSSGSNAQVQVLTNGNLIKTVSTDVNGNWDAGITNILQPGLNVIRVNLVVNSQIVISHVSNVTILDNFSDDALFVYGSQSQTSATSSYSPIPFDNLVRLGTWTYSNSKFKCNQAGAYLIQYTANAGVSENITTIDIGTNIAINSIEYLGSESNAGIDFGTNLTKTLTRSFVKQMNSGDLLTFNLAVNISGGGSGFTAGLMQDPNAVGTQPVYSLTITRIS